MPAQNSQPTVLVKKSDGSFARMTLDEVNKMRGIAAPPAGARNGGGIAASLPSVAPRNDDKPALLPSQQPSRVDEIIGKLSFKVPPEYINRLRSLAQLRVKGVRDDRQTKETAMRALKDGGLGLSETQADELLKKCSLSDGIAASPPANRRVVVRNDNAAADSRFRGNDNEKRGNDNAGRGDNTMKRAAVGIAQTTFASRPTFAAVHQSMSAGYKPAVRDVIVKPARMSPVDEIKYFTLTDFRRLSSVPAEAANRLKQKFINLKEESYLLFLEAMEKWRQSPLFEAYMAMVEGALSNRAKLSPSGDRETIQLPEIYAIIEMEKLLS